MARRPASSRLSKPPQWYPLWSLKMTSINDTSNQTTTKKKKGPKAIWTGADLKKLMDIAVEHRGLLGEGGNFKPQFYTAAEDVLGPMTTRGAKWFSKELTCAGDLLDTPGLSFSVEAGLKITNANQHVWDTLLKSKNKETTKAIIIHLAADGCKWYDKIAGILPSQVKGTQVFRASQAQSNKAPTTLLRKEATVLDGEIENNDNNNDKEEEEEDHGGKGMAVDGRKSASNSGTYLDTSSAQSKPISTSMSVTLSGKQKYSAVKSISVVSATPSKTPCSSDAAAINGLKEQVQRMVDNQGKHDEKRYKYKD
ncbi:hypothetical protein SERLADRAFT_412248 [Serpula lacrymans var. lacrymans S7.9]|uniref:Myb/SANT-like domain-containing protein n=1 Tax=Serpula lacrymans var. lacrymans (strain S7.9) TaxID=578457 RepID=F8PEN3_SERL9|nr:uncharacterized protein SERLADRAFT_412248 [Serpula lacrymans var. lacrymans S7.9]EGO18429.1 hypothetical protein SERLADRAFT_412248 [Serpula lacrymans var. lacrymans S7.9]